MQLQAINTYKNRYASALPELSWQFVVFGHNERDLPEARRLCRELGMKFQPKLNYAPHYSPVIDAEHVRRETGLGVASRDEFARRTTRPYCFPCTQMWTSPQINWDGALLGCCVNTHGDYGNVFEDGLAATLQGWKYVHAKEMITGLRPARAEIPCYHCNLYGVIRQLHRSRKPAY